MDAAPLSRAALQQLVGLTREVSTGMHALVADVRAANGRSFVDGVATVALELDPKEASRLALKIRYTELLRSINDTVRKGGGRTTVLWIDQPNLTVAPEQAAVSSELAKLAKLTDVLGSRGIEDAGIRHTVAQLHAEHTAMRATIDALDGARAVADDANHYGWAGYTTDRRAIIASPDQPLSSYTDDLLDDDDLRTFDTTKSAAAALTDPETGAMYSKTQVGKPLAEQLARIGSATHRLDDAVRSTSRADAVARINQGVADAARAWEAVSGPGAERYAASTTLRRAAAGTAKALPESIRSIGRDALRLVDRDTLRVDLARLQDLHATALARLEGLDRLRSLHGAGDALTELAPAIEETRSLLGALDDEITRLYQRAGNGSTVDVTGSEMGEIAKRLGMRTGFTTPGVFVAAKPVRDEALAARTVDLFDELASKLERPGKLIDAASISNASLDDAISAALQLTDAPVAAAATTAPGALQIA